MTSQIKALAGAALVAFASVPSVAFADPPRGGDREDIGRRIGEQARSDFRHDENRYHSGYGNGYDRRHDRRYDDRSHHGRYDRHDDDDDGDALAAGIIGLVIGAVAVAALTSGNDDQRNDQYSYEDQRYRDAPPAYGYQDPYQPRTCIVREPQYDPYVGRTLMIEKRVPC
jgi:hypothetical protein